MFSFFFRSLFSFVSKIRLSQHIIAFTVHAQMFQRAYVATIVCRCVNVRWRRPHVESSPVETTKSRSQTNGYYTLYMIQKDTSSVPKSQIGTIASWYDICWWTVKGFESIHRSMSHIRPQNAVRQLKIGIIFRSTCPKKENSNWILKPSDLMIRQTTQHSQAHPIWEKIRYVSWVGLHSSGGEKQQFLSATPQLTKHFY